MRPLNNLDLGSIKIHKQAIAEIVVSAIKDLDGVALSENALLNKALQWFDQKMYPGINVDIDENHDVAIEVRVVVSYGMNIPSTAVNIQDTVKAAIEKMMDINLKDINVSVVGIKERGTK